MFGPLRARLDLKSRRKRSGKTVAMYRSRRGSSYERVVDSKTFPLAFMGLKWAEPGILRHEPPRAKFEGEIVALVNQSEIDAHVPPGDGIRLAQVGPDQFARMLAKIAHAFATAEFGGASFVPLLPPYILGQQSIGPYLVGGDTAPRTKPILFPHYISGHVLWRDRTPHYLTVSIEFFAGLGLPRYQVVVGRLLRELPVDPWPAVKT